MRERTLQAGDRVGPYTIAGHLGSGGMGEVYRAHDSRLNRSIALKVLPANVERDAVRRFTAEAQAASALNHPHILSIFEAGQSDDVHYIAMELIDGETLRAHIQRANSPSPATRRSTRSTRSSTTRPDRSTPVTHDASS